MKPVTNWQKRYEEENTQWDLGAISTPLKKYFDQLTNKKCKILIPGGGNGYEAEYLHHLGFENITLLDIADAPLTAFAKRNPNFPKENLIQQNFFDHQATYDLIVEQTFFCAINPEHRNDYAEKVHQLLKPEGRLVGLFWSVPLNSDHPPFGGSKKEYHSYFDMYFDYVHFSEAHNSIKPRAGRELFLLAQKKNN